jgi:hypothetical protein
MGEGGTTAKAAGDNWLGHTHFRNTTADIVPRGSPVDSLASSIAQPTDAVST